MEPERPSPCGVGQGEAVQRALQPVFQAESMLDTINQLHLWFPF